MSSRRTFLKNTAAAGGVFVLGAHVFFPRLAKAQVDEVSEGIFDPNVFVKVAPDSTVTVISKHFEMGQGITTGLATLVAEELNADWSKMRYEFAPANAKLYNNLIFGPVMATGDTTSTAEAWVQMRKVGAAARMMFIRAAASKWGVAEREIYIEKGVVIDGGSGRRSTLGELAPDAMHVPVPTDVPLKQPKDWILIGSKLPRLDSHEKTNGTAVFALDIVRPNRLIAVVKRPDLFGSKVVSFDATETQKIKGVVEVVQIPSGVAVLAKDTWSAIRGRKLLKVTWDTSAAEKRSTKEIFAEYRDLAKTPGLPAEPRGNAGAAIKTVNKHYEAEFTLPYLAHTPMEPLNATLQLTSEGAEMWSGCQLQSIDQFAIAQVLGLKPEQVKINTLLGGGSFGRRGNPACDWTIELAEVAKAMRSRVPVHIVWTREDDVKGGYYRPMVLHQAKIGIDAKGHIAYWQHTVVNKSIYTGTPFEPMSVKNGLDLSSIEGFADTPYGLTDLAIDVHGVKSAVPVLWWRSVGHSHTAFVVETILDDLAHRTNKDPVQLRLELLAQQPRDAAVVKLAAEKAGWGGPLAKGHVQGFAYHRSYGTHVGMVAEISITDNITKVHRMVAVVDRGVPINPDIITAQVEGAIGFALSMVLRNEITLDKGLVQQSNFDDYEPTRMREMPMVEVHIIPSEDRPSGIGEPGVPPVAPAIANALFAATGKRAYSLPLHLKTRA
jgi:isoquinoline 1-oxidoreductase beta subunit